MEKIHIPGTAQELFNKAYLGVIKQGKPSRSDNGYCVFRGKDNCKCAVGHLIPDNKYKLGMEIVSFHDFLEFDDDEAYKAASALQIFHDTTANNKGILFADNDKWLENFKASAKEYAKKHNLEIP